MLVRVNIRLVKTAGWNFLGYDALRLQILITENNCTRKKVKKLQCQNNGWSKCEDNKLTADNFTTENIGELILGRGIKKVSVKQEK
jgi:hypothetical protein